MTYTVPAKSVLEESECDKRYGVRCIAGLGSGLGISTFIPVPAKDVDISGDVATLETDPERRVVEYSAGARRMKDWTEWPHRANRTAEKFFKPLQSDASTPRFSGTTNLFFFETDGDRDISKNSVYPSRVRKTDMKTRDGEPLLGVVLREDDRKDRRRMILVRESEMPLSKGGSVYRLKCPDEAQKELFDEETGEPVGEYVEMRKVVFGFRCPCPPKRAKSKDEASK